MQEISLIEYKNWIKRIQYRKFEIITDDIKQVVSKLVSENELKKIKEMPLDELQEAVERGLNREYFFKD